MGVCVLELHKEKTELLWWTLQSLRWTTAGSSRSSARVTLHRLPPLSQPVGALGLQSS